ncbi:uncharacterized protein FIBRA_05885 [Fibroporia radiculosa]|uniref:DNA-directed RNA polymerase III subunit RPC9 n=1 Tax=Fibroporia radiculosa TaxID=599839 RepID=J4H3S2_9APHY|nr:uncharacterized protein FIBRA_05885 [Fibroporia radiculosa]CCM03739.1 predicted protein [Fibroporia radiculosa]
MEVLNPRSALLSNYEVLTLLRELESDHLTRTKTALRIKKEEELAGTSTTKYQPSAEEISENLRTIEVEAIQYLSADYQPTGSQTEASITQLMRSLATYSLTKAEKLQIVNLAPTEAVELYVVVEELEERFGEEMEDMLGVVRSSLSNQAAAVSDGIQPSAAGVEGDAHQDMEIVYNADDDQQQYMEDGAWEYDPNEMLFDDTGEGAGIEGDLDVEDD